MGSRTRIERALDSIARMMREFRYGLGRLWCWAWYGHDRSWKQVRTAVVDRVEHGECVYMHCVDLHDWKCKRCGAFGAEQRTLFPYPVMITHSPRKEGVVRE